MESAAQLESAAPGPDGRAAGRFSVAGTSVLITGATGALGSAAARALAQAGAALTLAGANVVALGRLAAELGGETPVGPPGRAVTPVIRTVPRRPETPDDAAEMVRAAVAAHGRLDGVLVASGMNHVAPITAMNVADFQQVQDANVRGSWLVCQAAGRQLIEQGEGGSVVLVSSTRGRLGHPAGYSAYCPSKAAVDLLARSLAAEWGSAQIRVNALAPTVFRSDLTAWMYADDERGRATREAMLARIPLGRLAEPGDLVGALQFLLSDASAFLTGQVLYLDGGYTAC
ncbi:MAG: putative oxidoreductase [Actinomycetia bacterium]|jgi:NAD(P)-dependent dehydrogenase (short-subunit alcohol dehydrogenase family)|nr:putative oxidoreductase [Actinomycetes bacterium]